MAPSLTGFEFGVLCITAFLCAVPVVVVGFVALRVILRQSDLVRDVTKANMALSEKPSAVIQAQAMEASDRNRLTPQNGRVPQRPHEPAR